MYTIKIGCPCCGHELVRATATTFERFYVGKTVDGYGFMRLRCPGCGEWAVLSGFESELISLCRVEHDKYLAARKAAKKLADHYYGRDGLGWAVEAMHKPAYGEEPEK